MTEVIKLNLENKNQTAEPTLQDRIAQRLREEVNPNTKYGKFQNREIEKFWKFVNWDRASGRGPVSGYITGVTEGDSIEDRLKNLLLMGSPRFVQKLAAGEILAYQVLNVCQNGNYCRINVVNTPEVAEVFEEFFPGAIYVQMPDKPIRGIDVFRAMEKQISGFDLNQKELPVLIKGYKD